MNNNLLVILIKTVVIIVFTIFIAAKSIVLSLTLLSNAGCSLKNYRNRDVVFGMGISFIPAVISSIALALLFFKNMSILYVPYLFGVSSIGFAGLLDDLIGNKQVKGLKNHIVSFFRGELTTGFIKAFIGSAVAIVISFGVSKNILDFILNIFIIALFTNTLNLMDLRPGRCIKVFFSTGIIVTIININDIVTLIPLIVMLTTALIYIIYDLKELCMLGDTGSNILGITLGYFSSVGFDMVSKLIIVSILFFINIIAEKFSITKIIMNNRFLSYLDNWGRSSG
jgi:hypothetical protein